LKQEELKNKNKRWGNPTFFVLINKICIFALRIKTILKRKNMIDYGMVSKALLHLVNDGYGDLVEEKRKNEVTENLKRNFPDMDRDTLNEVLNCVIF
jgi:hypothetical protein